MYVNSIYIYIYLYINAVSTYIIKIYNDSGIIQRIISICISIYIFIYKSSIAEN